MTTGERIGIIIDQIEGRYQTRLIKALRERLEGPGRRVVVFNGRALHSPHAEDELQNGVYGLAKDAGLDGLIVAAGSVGNYLDVDGLSAFLGSFAPLPRVAIGVALPGIPSVVTDNEAGMKDCVRHLARDHGLSRLAFLAGPRGNRDADERLRYFLAAARECGIEPDGSLIYAGDFSYGSGMSAGARMPAGGKLPFDALVCANDEMAMGAEKALGLAGFRAPYDYAIAGFDDLVEAPFIAPRLTTVRQQFALEASLAGGFILDAIAGRPCPALTELPAHFLRRESCGCSFAAAGGAGRHAPPAIPEGADRFALALDDRFGTGPGAINPAPAPKQEVVRVAASLLDGLLLDLRSFRQDSLFLQGLGDWLEISFGWESWAESWLFLFDAIAAEAERLFPEQRQREYRDRLMVEARWMLALRSDQRRSRQLLVAAEPEQNLRRLAAVLSREIGDGASTGAAHARFAAALAAILPDLGIERALICVHPEGSKKGAEYGSLLALPVPGLGGIAETTVARLRDGGSFPPALADGEGELVVQPLAKVDLHFGYLLLSGRNVEPAVFAGVRDELSQALYVAALFQERKEAEARGRDNLEELRRSEERYREMALMLPMLMWETDLNLRTSYANQAAAAELGIAPKESVRPLLVLREGYSLEDLVGELREGLILENPGLRVRRKEGKGAVPVVQLSPIRPSHDSPVAGIRWSAFDPGRLVVDSVMPDAAFFDEYGISAREREIVLLMLQGQRIRAIAQRLCISESTVKGHHTHIYDKLGVNNAQEMLSFIQRHQVKQHGYNTYLFSVLNHLLFDDESER